MRVSHCKLKQAPLPLILAPVPPLAQSEELLIARWGPRQHLRASVGSPRAMQQRNRNLCGNASATPREVNATGVRGEGSRRTAAPRDRHSTLGISLAKAKTRQLQGLGLPPGSSAAASCQWRRQNRGLPPKRRIAREESVKTFAKIHHGTAMIPMAHPPGRAGSLCEEIGAQ